MPRLKMHGPVLGRTVVCEYLLNNLPETLAGLRLEWNIGIELLPDPVLYVPREPDALDRWPTIAVTTGLESETRRLEHGELGGEYATQYPMEVYAWVNAEGRGTCQDMRDYLATAVRVALLMNPTLTRPEQDMLVNESTLTQQYSDLQKVKGDRWVAGSLTTFDLAVVEHMGPFGTMTTPTVGLVAVRGYSEGRDEHGVVEFPQHPAFE